MPEEVNLEKVALLESTFPPSSRFKQSDLLSEHDQTGLCLGLAMEWIIRRSKKTALPPSANMSAAEQSRARFNQALGNLQKAVSPKAVNQNFVGGRAVFDLRRVAPDPETNIAINQNPTEIGDVPADAYNPTIGHKTFATKLADKTNIIRTGLMSPAAKRERLVCVHSLSRQFRSLHNTNVDINMMRLMIGNPGIISSREDYARSISRAIRDSTRTIKYRYGVRGLADPFENSEVCAIVGLRNPSISAHALAISVRSKSTHFVTIFDPNIGEFDVVFPRSFLNFMTILLAAFYTRQGFYELSLEWYDRLDKVTPQYL